MPYLLSQWYILLNLQYSFLSASRSWYHFFHFRLRDPRILPSCVHYDLDSILFTTFPFYCAILPSWSSCRPPLPASCRGQQASALPDDSWPTALPLTAAESSDIKERSKILWMTVDQLLSHWQQGLVTSKIWFIFDIADSSSGWQWTVSYMTALTSDDSLADCSHTDTKIQWHLRDMLSLIYFWHRWHHTHTGEASVLAYHMTVNQPIYVNVAKLVTLIDISETYS